VFPVQNFRGIYTKLIITVVAQLSMSLGFDTEVTFPPEAVALSISLHSKSHPSLYLDPIFLLLLTANPLQTSNILSTTIQLSILVNYLTIFCNLVPGYIYNL